MYYISKGIPEKGGITAQLRIVTGGQIFTLFGLDETLWLRARFEVVATATPEEEDVYPPQKAPAAPTVSSRSLFACTWRRLSPEASPIKR